MLLLLRHLLNLQKRKTTTTRNRLPIGVNETGHRKPRSMMILMTILVLASVEEVVGKQVVERCRA
jgi:hypothetical protein